MGPFVKFLRTDFQCAKDRQKVRDEWVVSIELRHGRHGDGSKGNTQFVNIVAKASLRNGPWSTVMTLEGCNNSSHDGRAAIAVVVDRPVQDTGTKVGQDPTANGQSQRLGGSHGDISTVVL